MLERLPLERLPLGSRQHTKGLSRRLPERSLFDGQSSQSETPIIAGCTLWQLRMPNPIARISPIRIVMRVEILPFDHDSLPREYSLSDRIRCRWREDSTFVFQLDGSMSGDRSLLNKKKRKRGVVPDSWACDGYQKAWWPRIVGVGLDLRRKWERSSYHHSKETFTDKPTLTARR